MKASHSFDARLTRRSPPNQDSSIVCPPGIGSLPSSSPPQGVSISYSYNVADRDNTGAASAPIVLSLRWDEPGAGDTVIMVVVDSGLAWSSLHLEVDA